MTAEAQRYREFRMPDVGEGLTEAEILKWLVKAGDTVCDGQVVVEVETAKAAVELPIPYDGRVREILFDEGTTVDVGTTIIRIDTDPSGDGGDEGGDGAAEASAGGGRAEAAERREPVLVGYGVATGATRRRPRKNAASAAVPPQAAAPAPAPAQARPLAKPPVRKLAKDLGVDLTTVIPSGANGVVTRDDVHAAAAPAPAPVSFDEPAAAPSPAPDASRERRVPIKGVRKATAQAMVASAFTAPHATEFVTVDVTRTVRMVERMRADPDLAGLRINTLLLVARAFLIAIRRHPEVNASWDEERQEIVIKDYVNLGIAAATPRGLIVPNIKDAGARTLAELSRALGDLVTTAREGRTSLADMRDGTVTITNIGVFGIDTGTPILTPGESAILALGAVREQPWVHKGRIKIRQVTTLALSFDHRLVDGELGSRVLADVAAVLEHPKRLFTWG
ncbi:dihydrolipoamide acetyltransferase family protein [Streptomyces radicis]|uniref:Dihydrolipoamide acetyltransferase component of pyruvate dehydrogenase complex n=1 Tax=Streptomyces radicis TaxID=1750517 RepID=A0A3A9WF15_9ACTN|nr:dihydrolipoamide acetyltransferase family protein [Streptomyces radicis]RKN11370.1 2-oxo acid dehydrogenase subunit E2 [Streptomyces radicis]RKN26843.1 2-oxo acid dehydrogenase subunit E2 [Streptomyces radicis]